MLPLLAQVFNPPIIRIPEAGGPLIHSGAPFIASEE